MSYTASLPGLEGQQLELKTSFWSSPKLLVNGQPAPQGSNRSELMLRRNDGSTVVAQWKPQLMGLDVPQLLVDGKTITVVEPLKWYQVLFSVLPIALVFFGGALGALAGAIAVIVNLKVFRTELPGVVKYVVAAGVSLAAVVLYFVAAIAFALVING